MGEIKDTDYALLPPKETEADIRIEDEYNGSYYERKNNGGAGSQPLDKKR